MTKKFKPQPDEIQPHVNTLELKAILVVDDDQQLASALQWILADENFFVDVAFDGEEALLKLKTHEYDAVVCDLKMPRLRGDEFYLRAKEMRPNLAGPFHLYYGFRDRSQHCPLPQPAWREVPDETFPRPGANQLR